MNAGNRAFAGINLGAVPLPISSIAFGRDNGPTFINDRTLSAGVPYVLQFTQVANPGVATADTGVAATGWKTIGALDYQSAGGTNFAFGSAYFVPLPRDVFR